MVLKLDPRVAIVWRDPFSLQFGVDPARVILREVSTAEERMISALSSGVSRSGLAMIARSCGVTDSAVGNLLDRIEPLLGVGSPPTASGATASRTAAIVGTGPTVERIAEALAQAGIRVIIGTIATDEPCDIGLAVGHYVLDPESYGFWLRRDLPHLPVVFGETSVTVGPVVEPGLTPCLYCLEHYRRDDDAAWSAIASQLWGRRSTAETPLVSREVAARVARMVVRRLEGATSPRGGAAASFRLDAQTGEVTRREWMPHPDCGCIRLPGNPVSEGRPESDCAHGQDLPTISATVVGPA
jgi:bacteriocin biosynthesis cyclodehydratase domain-containing protein